MNNYAGTVGCAVDDEVSIAPSDTSVESGLASLGGCKTRFPNLGGVVLLMNSILVGNLAAA